MYGKRVTVLVKALAAPNLGGAGQLPEAVRWGSKKIMEKVKEKQPCHSDLRVSCDDASRHTPEPSS